MNLQESGEMYLETILMLKNNLNMGYYMYYTYICRHIKYDIYMYITK